MSFAVVLLTPDDMARPAAAAGKLRPRARQNVILELGFFVGRLGRNRVGVLYEEGVELPSDYHGVEYIAVTASGEWRQRLANELVAAGVTVDLSSLAGWAG